MQETLRAEQRCGWLRLATCIAALGGGWLVLLPMAAETPAMRDRIQRHERMGVDPSAKFYTELPAMPGVMARVEKIRRRAPEALGEANR